MMNIITVKHWIFEQIGLKASGYNRAIVWDTKNSRPSDSEVIISGVKVKETEKAVQYNLTAISDYDAMQYGANINTIPDDVKTFTWSAWIPKSAIIKVA